MPLLIVSTLEDSGAGSLREAIGLANVDVDADTIVFDPALLGEIDHTIFLTSSLVITQGTVTINGDLDGDGDPDVEISGDADQSAFGNAGDVGILLQIDAGATATIGSMVFKDGFAAGAQGSDGGGVGGTVVGDGESVVAGIVNAGTLTLRDAIVRDNVATGGDSGENDGPNLNDNGGQGGSGTAGLRNSGALTIEDSVFLDNTGTGGDGGYGNRFGGDGGDGTAGIYIGAGSTNVKLDRVLMNGSSTTGGDGGYGIFDFGGDGGDAVNGLFVAAGSPSGIFGGTAGAIGYAGSGGAKGVSDSGADGADGNAFDYLGNIGGVNFIHQDSTGRFGSKEADIRTVSAFETFFGLQGGDYINAESGYVQIFAGSGNDTIKSAAIEAGTRFNGGSGIDTLDISNANLGGWPTVLINMSTGIANLTDGDAGSPFTAANFENFIGSDNAYATDDITGTDGANTLSGLAGNDILRGEGGKDNLSGGDGADQLFGGDDDDTLFGGNQNDVLNGDDGKDILFGENGNDRLFGGAQNDRLNGGNQNDLLNGGDGNDILIGGSGKDRLIGGAQNDKLSGGKSNDKLTGGGGRDQFAFTKKDGRDTVLDFQDRRDKFDLKGFDFKSKGQALSHFREVGNDHNNVVKFAFKGTVVTIKGADLGDISGADILI